MSKDILDMISVESPCEMKWSDMTGDDLARHCERCETTVHDLSALTREDARKLIFGKSGKMCVRYHADNENKIINAEPVTIDRRDRRPIAACLLALSLSVSGAAIAQRSDPAVGSCGNLKSVLESSPETERQWIALPTEPITISPENDPQISSQITPKLIEPLPASPVRTFIGLILMPKETPSKKRPTASPFSKRAASADPK